MDARALTDLAAQLSGGEIEAVSGKRRVLFVCMGNICRSPAAEGLLRRLVVERGLEDEVEIDSAGTIAYHVGEPPDERMRAAAARRGYQLAGASRSVTPEDFRRFDLIVAMDGENLRDLEARAGDARSRLCLFSDFLSAESPRDVPDPYYEGPSGFDRVLDMVEAGCPSLLEALLTADSDSTG